MKIEMDESDFIKLMDALKLAYDVEMSRDILNAKIHMSKNVRLSPITSILEAEVERSVGILNDLHPRD
jgi:hypothetical protein